MRNWESHLAADLLAHTGPHMFIGNKPEYITANFENLGSPTFQIFFGEHLSVLSGSKIMCDPFAASLSSNFKF